MRQDAKQSDPRSSLTFPLEYDTLRVIEYLEKNANEEKNSALSFYFYQESL